MNIDSKNKRILVLSDVHQNIGALERITKRENYDEVVCLGDWFDSFFYDTDGDVEKTCEFLKNWIVKDNFHTTWGNHDLPYFHINKHTLCSGYSPDKDTLIRNALGESFFPIRDKFRWYVWIDDWFCSHAGVNPHFFPPRFELNKPNLSVWLDKEIEIAKINLSSGNPWWLYTAGRGRGGNQMFGGITWQDFNSEFEPIDGLKQIVGHTVGKKVVNHWKDGNVNLTECDNLNIDCHLNEYLIISNGKVSVKSYIDL